MSDNPYRDQHGGFPGETRTSVISVIAAVFAFIICIPPISLVGMLLGWVGLRSIDKSQGRLTGKALAVTAIVVGLVVSVIQFAIGAGVLQAHTFWSKQMVTVGDRAMVAVAANDADAVRDVFTTTAGPSVTEERVELFARVAEINFGAYQRTETSVFESFGIFAETYSRSHTSNVNVNANTTPTGVVPVPAPLVFDRGGTILWMLFDENSLSASPPQPRLVDIILQIDGVKGVTLAGDPTSEIVANSMNLSIVSIEDAAQKADANAPAALPEAPAEPNESPDSP